ncbi:MAG TPA: aminotransferase class V-fold PLP-dependent enzyme [Thermoanaerobaculia bacterium]
MELIREVHPAGGAWSRSVSAGVLADEARFQTAWPEYASTRVLDEFRARELSRLDRARHVYLDSTGGGLYGESQVRRHAEILLANTFGNPHSSNPASLATTERVESARRRVLDFFQASPDEYEVAFTANASHALKLVGESYPFSPGAEFLLTFDNHNSVNGIREFDRARGAHTTYIPVQPPEMRVDESSLDRFFDRARPDGNNLFAYPAQSNFSGAQHPLDWIARAQARGWDVLLDAAAFVPTNRLDLSRWHPDFVALSFYKMFGYPTGVGALIARKETLRKLHRPWFAGGTIAVASVQADRYTPAQGAAAFEDGTLNYLSLPAVEIGLDLLDSIGIETIHRRVHCLTGWLLEKLQALRHGSGVPLIDLYGPRTMWNRGGTVAFNFRDARGRLIDHREVEEVANHRRISLRTGCFCNPGAGELALGITRNELVTCFRGAKDVLTYEELRNCIHREGTGAVRVSVGMASNFADVEAFLRLAEDFVED